MDRDSQFTQIKVTRMGGIDQRTSPDELDAEGRPNFSTLEGLYPAQDGLLSRVPGKSLLASLPGEIILNIFQPFDSSENIIVQTDQNLYAFALNELLGRSFTPTITPAEGVEDEHMSYAILTDLRGNATNGGPLGTAAFGTLTCSANPLNTETVTIDIKTYTFQTTLTNVDGNVKIGATLALTLANLAHAINGTGGVAGTDYAAATVANTVVRATNSTGGTSILVVAIVPGTIGNAIVTTETLTNGAWGGGTLASGALAAADTFYVRTLNTKEADADSFVTFPAATYTNSFTLPVGTYRISLTAVWNPVDGGAVANGTTLGLYNETSGAFEVYSGTSEPIIGMAGKGNSATNIEAGNYTINLEGVFTIITVAKTYSIRQKSSLAAAAQGLNFCGIHDQCTTNSNVNGAKSKNRFLIVKLWQE